MRSVIKTLVSGKKKNQSNFFYGFFCLIRSDGFLGFNSFIVLMEVYVGLVRFQKKRSSCLDVQIASKQKVARSFGLVPAIFQAKMQLVAAKNKKSKVENCCNVATCCLFLVTRSDGHDIINTML